ncbi:hypothetical protein EVAR_93194_1 [Eumeta japonica]|uniref:Uncharacterized protein n=1 Tax=Eumeta variegata TaxID=151549 RepID=A0A4C1TYU3_EUMVA|nr:hypothetical protein EVAR_93194_1 [Eumeta japonica]
MQDREPQRSLQYDREPVYRAHVALMRKISKVHVVLRSSLEKLVLQKTSLNIETLSIILSTRRKNPYSEATVKKIRSAGLRGGAEIAVTIVIALV